jgi:hypothetical protein
VRFELSLAAVLEKWGNKAHLRRKLKKKHILEHIGNEIFFDYERKVFA